MTRAEELKAKITMYFADQCGLTRLEMNEIYADQDLIEWFGQCELMSSLVRPDPLTEAGTTCEVPVPEEFDPRLCDCGSGEEKWMEYDARGIALCSVCSQCIDKKLSKYRRSVLVDADYECDEPIDEDY